MTTSCRILRFVSCALAGLALAATLLRPETALAHSTAKCKITSVSVSPSTMNAGAVTPPAVPAPRTITLTLMVSYTNGTGGNCDGAIAFYRAAGATPALRRTGGSDTLPYQIKSGGASLITSSGLAPTSYLPFSINVRHASGTAIATVSVDVQLSPSGLPTQGSYSDSLELRVYRRNGAALTTDCDAARQMILTASVNAACSFASFDNRHQTIQVSSKGMPLGMATPPPRFVVSCNAPSRLTLTSKNGGMTLNDVAKQQLPRAATGFKNWIDYQVNVSGPAGTLSLSTSSATSASSRFSMSTFSGRSGNVVIQPLSGTEPLLSGNYSDQLNIVIDPQ